MATRRSRLQVKPNIGGRNIKDVAKASRPPRTEIPPLPVASQNCGSGDCQILIQSHSAVNTPLNNINLQSTDLQQNNDCSSRKGTLSSTDNEINTFFSLTSEASQEEIYSANSVISGEGAQFSSNSDSTFSAVTNLNLISHKSDATNDNEFSSMNNKDKEHLSSKISNVENEVDSNAFQNSDNALFDEEASSLEQFTVNKNASSSNLKIESTKRNSEDQTSKEDLKKPNGTSGTEISLVSEKKDEVNRNNKLNNKAVLSKALGQQKNTDLSQQCTLNIGTSSDKVLSKLEMPPAARTESSALENSKNLTGGKNLEKKTGAKSNGENELLVQKRRRYRIGEPPERNKMIMQDLIYWNPSSNPMSYSSEPSRPKATENLPESQRSKELDQPIDTQTDNSTVPGPRLMIGPDGEITLDEDSLVIQRTDTTSSLTDVIYDTPETTYASFRKIKSKTKRSWNKKDTAKFYKALGIVGTDFGLMCQLFPERTRDDLKNKFKREEKYNRNLVDKAINDRQHFDLSNFDDESSEDEEEQDKKASKPQRKRQKSALSGESIKKAKLDTNKTKQQKKQGSGQSKRKRHSLHFYGNEDEVECLDNTKKFSNRPNQKESPEKENKKRRCENANISSSTDQDSPALIVAREEICATEDISNVSLESYDSIPGSSVPVHNIHDQHIEIMVTPQSVNSSGSCDAKSNSSQTQTANSAQNIPLTIVSSPADINDLNPGQLILLASKNHNDEQTIHVYFVSPTPVPSSENSAPSISTNKFNDTGTSSEILTFCAS